MDSRDAESVEILNNQFETKYNAVYANNSSGDYVIEGNTFNKTTTNGDWFVYLTNAASVTMENNEFTSLGGNGFYFNNTSVTVERNLLVTPGRGLELTNQAGGKVLNNTLISTGNGDYGIKVSNLSTPVMRNNIVQGLPDGDADRQRSDEHECEPQRALEHQWGAVHRHGPGAAHWGAVELQRQLGQL